MGAVERLVCVGAACLSLTWAAQAQEREWLRCAPSAAHGLGAVDSLLYTNSREAFVTNYARGFRVFEADVRYTRDSVLVLAHDWHTGERQQFTGTPTLAQFQAQPIYGRYKPLTLREFLALLRRYPDAYAILDLKSGATSAPAVLRAASDTDPALIPRLAPVAYSASDAATLRGLAQWPLVHSLHFESVSDDSVIAATRRYKVRAVVVNRFRLSERLMRALRGRGVGYYLSVVNTGPEARLYRTWGVQGFFTDLLGPDSLCP